MNGVFVRVAARLLGVTVAVTSGAALYLYGTNRREARVAQQMMEDASRLQIEKSSLSDVLAFNHKYNGDATGSWHDDPCLESDCLVTVAPDKNDFLERHPKLGYAAGRISRREWRFRVSMWAKDEKLTEIQQWFSFSTPLASSAVIATLSRADPGLCRTPYYRMHHTFAAYPSPKHFAVWVSPEAAREREMLRLNIDCVLRMSGCKSVEDMAPLAWRQYEADQRLIDANDGKSRDEIAADPKCR